MNAETLSLCLGLIILMGINICLGSLNAIFLRCFDWRKCIRGAIKSVIVMSCFAATYFVGSLNPGIIIINVSGIEADIMTAIHITVLTGYYHYAKQVIGKLGMIIGGSELNIGDAKDTAPENITRLEDKPDVTAMHEKDSLNS